MLRLIYGPALTSYATTPEIEALLTEYLTLPVPVRDQVRVGALDIAFIDVTERVVPTGLLPHVVAYAQAVGIPMVFESFPDLRVDIEIPSDVVPGLSLRPYQLEVVRAALTIGRGTIEIATGGGKCLHPDQGVLLHDGTVKRACDVVVGDRLLGPDSRPRRVLSTTTGRDQMYRVRPIKAPAFECNQAHVLTLVHSVHGDIVDVPLSDWLQWSPHQKHLHKLFAPGVVDFKPHTSSLPIDPYFLGVWLGDGAKSLAGVAVSKPDPEIRACVEDVAQSWGIRVREDDSNGTRCTTFHLARARSGGQPNALLDALRSLNFKESDWEIPHRYLTGSREERAALLAGLLDTDGHRRRSGYEIIQKRKRIADGVCFLARSLGMRAVMTPKRVRGYDTTYWRISISGDCTGLPLRIARKQPLPRKQRKNALRTGFKVEALGEGDYAGFALSGDGRFLLDSFIVTHNTLIATAITKLLGCPRTLFTCPDLSALREMHRRFVAAFGVDAVGIYGGGRKDTQHRIIIATIDGLYNGLKRNRVDAITLLRDCELWFGDEAHHFGTAKSWKVVTYQCLAQRRFALSGTPFDTPAHSTPFREMSPTDAAVQAAAGYPLCYLRPATLTSLGFLTPLEVMTFDVEAPPIPPPRAAQWKRVYDEGVVNHEGRNECIAVLVANLVDMGRRPLVSIEVLAHGRALQRLLLRADIRTLCAFGDSTFIIPRAIVNDVAARIDISIEELPDDFDADFVSLSAADVSALETELTKLFERGVIHAQIGSRIFDEVQDIPFLTDLVLASGMKAAKRYRQKIGRVIRLWPGKAVARCWEPYDTAHHLLARHSLLRLQIARSEGHTVIPANPYITRFLLRDHIGRFVTTETKEERMGIKEVRVEARVEATLTSMPAVTLKPAVTLVAEITAEMDVERVTRQLSVQALSLCMREMSVQATAIEQGAAR